MSDNKSQEMTEAEFEQKMTDVLSVLPFEFRFFVRFIAFERGCSNENRVEIARRMAEDLAQSVDEYTDRMGLKMQLATMVE